MAYYRAVCSFFAWLEQHGIGGLVDIEPFHVAAYIKALKVSDAGNPAVKERAAARPTVKQHLAAIRMLFDWLIVGQILAINQAHAVRGPEARRQAREDAGLQRGAGQATAREHQGRKEGHSA